jgi:hypothetical protein
MSKFAFFALSRHTQNIAVKNIIVEKENEWKFFHLKLSI